MLQIVGVLAVGKVIASGIGELIAQVAETWRNLKTSVAVGEMASDMRSLWDWLVSCLSAPTAAEWVIGIASVLVVNWLRVKLYVDPRRESAAAHAKRVKEKVPKGRPGNKSGKGKKP
ncbi:hypothetical protein [Methylobacterium platani]|uniref:hypothetical protein n=1 Tax=Methylobacterium platani TaxID=427683 RepID=UPI0012E0FB71|nr:hypothetical protein [Methylobacterium platani]